MPNVSQWWNEGTNAILSAKDTSYNNKLIYRKEEFQKFY